MPPANKHFNVENANKKSYETKKVFECKLKLIHPENRRIWKFKQKGQKNFKVESEMKEQKEKVRRELSGRDLSDTRRAHRNKSVVSTETSRFNQVWL